MQVNQHVFGSTHISFVSYAEPFTSSASSMKKPVKVRGDFEHAIFLKLKIGVSLVIGLQPCLVAVALETINTASSLR